MNFPQLRKVHFFAWLSGERENDASWIEVHEQELLEQWQKAQSGEQVTIME